MSSTERRLIPRRQRLGARRRAIDLEKIRRDGKRPLFAQRTGIGGRHRLNEIRKELVRRARPPLGPEISAPQGRCVGGSAEILPVTPRALLRIRGLTRLRLRCRVYTGGLRLLTAHRCNGETDEDSRSEKDRGPGTVHRSLLLMAPMLQQRPEKGVVSLYAHRRIIAWCGSQAFQTLIAHSRTSALCSA